MVDSYRVVVWTLTSKMKPLQTCSCLMLVSYVLFKVFRINPPLILMVMLVLLLALYGLLCYGVVLVKMVSEMEFGLEIIKVPVVNS